MRLACLLLTALLAAESSPATKVDALSTHRTDATFVEIRHLPCLHRTSLCPDRCGHAKDVAVFRITTYREYLKDNPNHGDPQAVEFLMPLTVGEEVTADQVAFARGLRAGDAVKLDWVHEYVRSPSSSYPRRRVTRLER